VSFFLSTVAVAALGLLVLPKTYVSESRLFVQIGRHSVGVTPTANVGSSLTITESRENEIRSMIDLIKSRTILEKVATKLGPHIILGGSMDASPDDIKGDDPKMVIDKAIKKLTKDLHVDSTKKSSVIGVSCKSNSPELSQKIVKEVIAAYRNHHLDVNSTDTFGFFGRQLKVISKETLNVSNELADHNEVDPNWARLHRRPTDNPGKDGDRSQPRDARA